VGLGFVGRGLKAGILSFGSRMLGRGRNRVQLVLGCMSEDLLSLGFEIGEYLIGNSGK